MVIRWQEKYYRSRIRSSINHRKKIERNINIIRGITRGFDVIYAGAHSRYALIGTELSSYVVETMKSYGYKFFAVTKYHERKNMKRFIFEKKERREKCKNHEDVLHRIRDSIRNNNYNRKFDRINFSYSEGLIIRDNGKKYKVTVRKTY